MQKELPEGVKDEGIIEADGHVNLLAGLKRDGELHTEVEYKGITGYVEEELDKADVRRNGGKIVNTLLYHTVERVGEYKKADMSEEDWKEIIRSMYVGDQDWVVLNIRKYTLGGEIETVHQCPARTCNEENRVFLDVDELDIMPFKGKHQIEFELDMGYEKRKRGEVVETRKKGKMRLPTGEDREILAPIAQKNMSKGNTMMLTRCVDTLGGKQVHEGIFKSLMSGDRRKLMNKLEENSFGVNLQIDVDCAHCGRKFTANLNVANFL